MSPVQVEENLVKVRNAGTEQDLGIQYKALKPEVDKLNIMAAKRQQVLYRLPHGNKGRGHGRQTNQCWISHLIRLWFRLGLGFDLVGLPMGC